MQQIPISIQIIFAVIGGVGVIVTIGFSFYHVGYKNCASKNGYVKEEVCEKNIDNFNKKFDKTENKLEAIHEKINDTNDEVSNLCGVVSTQTSEFSTIKGLIQTVIEKI